MKPSKKEQSKRKPNQIKKAKKAHKSTRGEGEYYDEIKDRISVGITNTARQGLDQMSEQLNLSRSELIERIGRGIIKLALPEG